MIPVSTSVAVDDTETAEALLGHDHDGLRHGASAAPSGRRSSPCIRSPHEFQPGAELAAGMKDLEVVRGEALALEQRDRQASPSASCIRVEVVGARPCGQASWLRQSEHDVGGLRRARSSGRCHGDERNGEAPRIGRPGRRSSACLAGPGKGQDHVVAR